MKCDMKMMLKAGLGLTAGVAVAYAVFPAARELIMALSPMLFLLICPLMMFFMMKGMHSSQSCHGDHQAGKQQLRPVHLPDANDGVKEQG
ncbi:DUF2933 domain-containing protein [Alcaligenes phenolicus]|uniref:DUF2933 domain-containing protein n=1 Tax=Alcaligenes phenolicus TaxID=232846 RepID=A0AAW5VS91_9BURK|nr:DUF2933 domain-containing protein [Alcaligenes phenolicus]MCX5565826.1 DUF2933 domain-containing protein [Alcaligenes phenolicus]